MPSQYTIVYHGFMIIMAFTWLGIKQYSYIVPDLILSLYPKIPYHIYTIPKLKNNNEDIDVYIIYIYM